MSLSERRVSGHYTWNKNWVDEYESPWGIIEKFRYANNVTWKELNLLFQRKDVTTKGERLMFSDLSSWKYVDEIALEKVFGFSLIKHYSRLILNLTRGFTVLPDLAHQYLRENLSFCNICISYGYHSLFHQFILLDTCPFHLCKLLYHCPSCNKKLEYYRSTFSEGPFQCNCGYSLLKHTTQTGFPWSIHIVRKIALPDLKKWIEHKEGSKFLYTLYFFEPNFLKTDNQVLNKFISVLDQRTQRLDERHEVLSHRLISSEKADIGAKDILGNELYLETRQIFKSIARYYRNTILFKHKKCIKRLVKMYPDNQICPFAYAYVHWRMNIEGIPNYWQVDNSFRCNNSTMFDHFYSKPDNTSLFTLFMQWTKSPPFINNKIAMKWGVNHVAVQLLTHHFNTWLKIANKFAPQRGIILTREHSYKNMPFFTISYSENGYKQVGFHLWKSLEEDNRNTLTQLNCPFR
ncbi:hypothetical protein T458_14740 [Brevibacillus panacihumi W25]|uniref:Uncharacterized protein n=1 Tax=Brevibacillus panacihumi W25 TaxID=1408254 RepID=V6M5C1_9BACL|nr:hypothetical protein [Brevibacillus panacihumi]EST53801.1 hypothetical protein T458_14740 [Brevibacillus panacihumi W25]